MTKGICLLVCVCTLACSSNSTAPTVEQKSRRLGEGLCAKPENRDRCLERLRDLAAQEKWGPFLGAFKELCQGGGAKCQVASQLKSGSKSPFTLKSSTDALYHQHHDDGHESYYLISIPQ